MKRAIMRVAVGILGLGTVAAMGTGCTVKGEIPADQMARLEAAANKAEAAANKAEASARSAADSAARAQAAVAKLESGWREEYNK